MQSVCLFFVTGFFTARKFLRAKTFNQELFFWATWELVLVIRASGFGSF